MPSSKTEHSYKHRIFLFLFYYLYFYFILFILLFLLFYFIFSSVLFCIFYKFFDLKLFMNPCFNYFWKNPITSWLADIDKFDDWPNNAFFMDRLPIINIFSYQVSESIRFALFSFLSILRKKYIKFENFSYFSTNLN